jgi:hypothetical protein
MIQNELLTAIDIDGGSYKLKSAIRAIVELHRPKECCPLTCVCNHPSPCPTLQTIANFLL